MTKYKYWNVKKVYKTDDSNPITVELISDCEDMTVRFKWDGCLDIRKYHNGLTPDSVISKDNEAYVNYMHICDMKDYIEKLKEVVKIAEDILDKEDFGEYWS